MAKTTRSYKTPKGTELPLLNLSGKEYLEVKYRLVWFREDHPDWSIETELMAVTDVSAYARAVIRDENDRIKATSHKFERIQGFPDFIEKAETGAIGRALALVGYGTQFCADELDASVAARNERSQANAAASPIAAAKPSASKAEKPAPALQKQADRAEATGQTEPEEQEAVPSDKEESQISSTIEPGDYLISFGRKYKGKKLKEIPKPEIESYIQWLETSDVRPGTALAHQVEYLKNAYERMYKGEAVPS